jgi:t-SNARE complex subunit (syntaxin)
MPSQSTRTPLIGDHSGSSSSSRDVSRNATDSRDRLFLLSHVAKELVKLRADVKVFQSNVKSFACGAFVPTISMDRMDSSTGDQLDRVLSLERSRVAAQIQEIHLMLMQMPQQAKETQQYQQALQQYTELLPSFKAATDQLMAMQKRSVGNMERDSAGGPTSEPQRLMLQKQQRETESIAGLVLERNERIREAQKEAAAVMEIFRVMQTLVDQQGDRLVVIENHTEDAKEDMYKVTEQLRKADQLQTSRRKKVCLIFVCLFIILGAISVPLVMTLLKSDIPPAPAPAPTPPASTTLPSTAPPFNATHL